MTGPRPLPTPRPAAPAARAAYPGREVELKLLAAPGDLARIAELPLVQSMAAGPAERLRQHTTYHDTPGFDLAARGLALRVRRQGNVRIQAVKTLGGGVGDAAGVAVRQEWEWAIATDGPDLSVLREGELAAAVPADVLDRLAPIFSTDIQRTILRLRPDPATEVELALDQGTTTATPPGKASAYRPVSEVELELKAGGLADLFKLASAIHGKVPLRLTTRSKADIGFSLLTGKAPKACTARPLGVTPVTTVAEAFRHIGRNALAQMLDNEAALLADSDPAALRELAAAVRRMDAGYSLFRGVVESPRGDGLRVELKRLGKPLEAARAWDRVATRVLEPLGGRGGAARHASAAVTQARRQSRQAALDLLNSPRWTAWLLDFAAWLEEGEWYRATPEASIFDTSMSAMAPELLAQRLSKLEKAAAKLGRDGVEAAWPKLWKRAQKLRYALDFCRAVMPTDRVKPLIQAVETLRDALKGAADAEQAAALLDDLRRDGDAALAAELRPPLARLRRARGAALARVPDAWRGVAQAAADWR